MKETLGQKPSEATALIIILSSNTKEALEEHYITDKNETILEVRRIITKRNLMLQLENKCHNLDSRIQKFHNKFNIFH